MWANQGATRTTAGTRTPASMGLGRASRSSLILCHRTAVPALAPVRCAAAENYGPLPRASVLHGAGHAAAPDCPRIARVGPLRALFVPCCARCEQSGWRCVGRFWPRAAVTLTTQPTATPPRLGPDVQTSTRESDCQDWNAASVEGPAGDRDVDGRVRGGATGTVGRTVPRRRGPRLFERACDPRYAGAFKLYKIYARAAAFSGAGSSARPSPMLLP